MNSRGKNTTVLKLLVILLGMALLSEGCGVYFNTFFNAKQSFNKAEKARKGSTSRRGGGGDYNRAIEKARKVVDNHPNSKYYDDALYILGVSYFHTEQYSRAERRFRELLANYEDSEFAGDSRIYLAKSKLQLGDLEDAMMLFTEIFNADYSREYKAEAALALGEFRFENEEYDLARDYFMAVRDSLGNDLQKRQAQAFIANGYYQSFRFSDAQGAYLQILGMDPDKDELYHALFRSAVCSYRLLRVDDGMAYLKQLVEDELYFDSLGVLRLMIAEGYEMQDDLALAEATYFEVTGSATASANRAQAYYRLGLIYQYDYDDLKQAKEYYDEAVQAARRSEWAVDALQRSSDIGKLDQFSQIFRFDSTTTQQDIDNAAFTQYQLSELYWLRLSKPDTAIMEMQYVVDSFPTAFDAPKAMIALSQMYREHHEDPQTADSILKLMLETYPKSDFVPEALDILGLRGTAADTGYAAAYFHRAENFLLDTEDYDSARFYYSYVVDSFPDSRYYLQARFNLIWLTDEYQAPGDSSLIFAYQEFADSFPGTPQAAEANRRLTVKPVRRQQDRDQDISDGEEEGSPADEDTLGTEQPADTSVGYIDPRVALYLGPYGDTLADLMEQPVQVEEPFEFPVEAYNMQDNAFYLYFQILVDFSGRVIDFSLKIPSPIDEVNRRASETIASMTFDALAVSQVVSRFDLEQTPDGKGYWFVYKYLVEKPEHLR